MLRAVTWAASTSKKRIIELPCFVIWPSRRRFPLESSKRSLDPDNFHLARCDLSGRFAVASRSHQAALVACQHAPKDRHRTFLRLRMRTAEADQSLRTMLSGGQSAQVCGHIAQVAARREGGPFVCGRVFQTVFSVVGVIETAHGLAILLNEV